MTPILSRRWVTAHCTSPWGETRSRRTHGGSLLELEGSRTIAGSDLFRLGGERTIRGFALDSDPTLSGRRHRPLVRSRRARDALVSSSVELRIPLGAQRARQRLWYRPSSRTSAPSPRTTSANPSAPAWVGVTASPPITSSRSVLSVSVIVTKRSGQDNPAVWVARIAPNTRWCPSYRDESVTTSPWAISSDDPIARPRLSTAFGPA